MTDGGRPFEFYTVAYLTRICNQKASTLAELVTGLDECSDASIFNHTFQTLGSHHFLTEGFSNDFAQWVLSSANRSELAEQLAGLDVRDYVSLAELRTDLRRLVADYCGAHPLYAEQNALEDFYFCESSEVTMSFGSAGGHARRSSVPGSKNSATPPSISISSPRASAFIYRRMISRCGSPRRSDASAWLRAPIALISTRTRWTPRRTKLLRLVDRELSRQ